MADLAGKKRKAENISDGAARALVDKYTAIWDIEFLKGLIGDL